MERRNASRALGLAETEKLEKDGTQKNFLAECQRHPLET